MPPKPKFTKEEIIAVALKLVSENGLSALTARDLGKALGSSSRPIFTTFKNMEELQEEVQKAAMRRFEAYLPKSTSDMPVFKQIGMKMVLFGMNEPKLFQLLFMRENQNASSFEDVFGLLGKTALICTEAIEKDYHLNRNQAKTLFENVWIYTFGVGALCATGVCRFSEEELGKMLTTEFHAMMLLIQSEKGEKNVQSRRGDPVRPPAKKSDTTKPVENGS